VTPCFKEAANEGKSKAGKQKAHEERERIETRCKKGRRKFEATRYGQIAAT
jgi:hypothetical protein